MRHYAKELIILFFQLFMFYIFPLFAGPTDAMGMVILILLSTAVLSLIIGTVSNNKIKYLYPIIVSVTFIPSVFIHYNESALIHSVWYFVDAGIGLALGVTFKMILCKIKHK